MKETNWTEEHIEALPAEDNSFERKGSALFDQDGKLRDELAKQLSAFANSGGGAILLGVADDGKIDGGLPLIAKGTTSTKDYLEDIIPILTEEKILGFRVVEAIRKSIGSRIVADRGVGVLGKTGSLDLAIGKHDVE